jgi:hypothetical protein
MSPPTKLAWWLKLANPLFATLIRLGRPVGTQRLLLVPGRKSGKLHETPVALLSVGGQRYIVSMPWAGWVRNARISGWGILKLGKQTERVRLTELDLEERVPIVRAFPAQLPRGVGFFQLPPDPEAFAKAAPQLVAFRVDSLSGSESSMLTLKGLR